MTLDITITGQWRTALGLAVVVTIVHEIATRRFETWTARQDWWPRARELQHAMLQNFGFPEDLSEAQVLESWSSVLAHCAIHAVSSVLMLRVLLAGSWEAATPVARDLFVLGTLVDVLSPRRYSVDRSRRRRGCDVETRSRPTRFRSHSTSITSSR